MTSPIFDADAELQGSGDRLRIARGDGTLALDGAQYRRDRAGEFGDDRIARRPENAAMVIGNGGIDDLPAGPQVGERSSFVFAHQPGKLMDVGGENCRQFAVDWSHAAATVADRVCYRKASVTRNLFSSASVSKSVKLAFENRRRDWRPNVNLDIVP